MKRRWLLLSYVLTNAALYSTLLPLWEGFDEPFHFGYVQLLANGSFFPDPRSSPLSQEVGSSLSLAPGSPSVQRNLPEITSYHEFFKWPDAKRKQARRQLVRIDDNLRWRPSHYLNYEGLQAPLAYLVLALPERALARLSLLSRVLVLRLIAAVFGGLLLFYGTQRLGFQLGISEEHREIVLFCAFSCQMTWATLAHVANDWLAVPLSVWLLVESIHYAEFPSMQAAAAAAACLVLGLLTKAYFLAFVPMLVALFVLRGRWREFGVGLLVISLAIPWYVRNIERYGTISGMQELREGKDPRTAMQSVRIAGLLTSIESSARSALWTGNNTFRAFSINTLRILLVVWLAALFLWALTQRQRAESIVLFHCVIFILALAYSSAINFVTSHGELRGPNPWYSQVLLVPVLALAGLGTSRSRNAGRVIASLLALLFGYILVVTYWVKLIPLYGGFGGRTSLFSVINLYREGASHIWAVLSQLSLGPAVSILFLSSLVTALAASQVFVLIRRVFSAQ